MTTCRRTADLFFSAFFASHIFITLLFDAQVILPPALYPQTLRDCVDSYVNYAGDYLVKDPPLYFKSLVYAELYFQLPLVVLNAYGFFYGTKWSRTTGLVYGVHTATTMIPILADIISSNIPTKSTLLSIYMPYFLIPLALTLHVLMRGTGSQTRVIRSKKRA